VSKVYEYGSQLLRTTETWNGVCRHRARDIGSRSRVSVSIENAFADCRPAIMLSIAFSLARRFSFLDTALTVIVAQAILQGSYFLGLVIRAVFTAAHRMRSAPLASDVHSRLRNWKNRLLF
jgi:hypothetical protein